MKNYRLKSLKEVGSPNDIFPLVMKYAEKTGENPWMCWLDVIRYSTVVVYEGDIAVSYVTSYKNDDGSLFIKTAVSDHPWMSVEVFEDICRRLQEEQGTAPEVYMESSLPERLWKRYGFIPHRVLYKKTLNHGGD